MPQYSDQPPKDPRGHGLPLVRTPANGRLKMAIVSEHMIGCPTHWYGGRTVPCESVDCDPCNEGYPWRWHGYVAGITGTTRNLVLFEFTATAAEQIQVYHQANGTLRGCILTATRHRNRHNGRVIIQTAPGNLAELNLPAAPDLTLALSRIWNLPQPNITTPTRLKGVPKIQIGEPDPILSANRNARRRAG